ncbi:hypothetical protein MTO96_041469, partial [Rhipicephalus appendiculatus]
MQERNRRNASTRSVSSWRGVKILGKVQKIQPPANIIILIASAGSISPQGTCIAAPPNSVTAPKLGNFDLGYAWYAVSLGSTYKEPSIITGLSFEMSALEYAMNDTIKSLNESLYKACVSVKKLRQA